MLQGIVRQFPEHLDSVAIAGQFVRVMHDIEVVLTPILGERGVAALLQRSFSLARSQHPWLADPFDGGDVPDLSAPYSALARRDPASARAAAVEGVLFPFHALLTSLIGAPLAERLFDATWASPANVPGAREHPTMIARIREPGSDHDE
jgi:hypothetical protein